MKINEIKNGAVVELKNKQRYVKIDSKLFLLKDIINCGCISLQNYQKDNLKLIDRDFSKCDIEKVNNDVNIISNYPTAYAFIPYSREAEWTWERPENILDDAEKQYLLEICKPYDVICISKCPDRSSKEYAFLIITIKSKKSHCAQKPHCECISLPYFKANKMYLNMEMEKEYTLEELGIKQ